MTTLKRLTLAALTLAAGTATLAAQPRYRDVTIPAGTRVAIRLDASHSTKSSRVEENADGTLAAAIRVNGVTVVPAGSRIDGIVSLVDEPGRVKGRGQIGLRFTDLRYDGERYPVAASYVRVAP